MAKSAVTHRRVLLTHEGDYYLKVEALSHEGDTFRIPGCPNFDLFDKNYTQQGRWPNAAGFLASNGVMLIGGNRRTRYRRSLDYIPNVISFEMYRGSIGQHKEVERVERDLFIAAALEYNQLAASDNAGVYQRETDRSICLEIKSIQGKYVTFVISEQSHHLGKFEPSGFEYIAHNGITLRSAENTPPSWDEDNAVLCTQEGRPSWAHRPIIATQMAFPSIAEACAEYSGLPIQIGAHWATQIQQESGITICAQGIKHMGVFPTAQDWLLALDRNTSGNEWVTSVLNNQVALNNLQTMLFPHRVKKQQQKHKKLGVELFALAEPVV